MAKKISAQEATLHTTTVEVKTLVISNRQVTLSVYRQIPKQDIICWENPPTLWGVPWGRVNYYFDECKKEDPNTHMHVVWQRESELRRACVESCFDSSLLDDDRQYDYWRLKSDYLLRLYRRYRKAIRERDEHVLGAIDEEVADYKSLYWLLVQSLLDLPQLYIAT